MGSPLIIVESPAKARSMGKYLGKEFIALASYGHVRSLPKKNNAVLPEAGFAMQYEIIEQSRRHVDAIAKAMKKADALYLATDPDREGEAIAWHLHELLKEKNAIGDKPVYRVAFNEITKSAIRKAVDAPRELSASLIDAQQARLALDYLIGFNLSPLLWKKVKYGLSAGRVQSPALRLICEREAEIDKFVAREYWSVNAQAKHKQGSEFAARLTHYEGEKLTQFSFGDEKRARGVETTLQQAASGKLHIINVEKKERKRNPPPPFTTSTLQQEAARKLGFTAKRTMQIAQQLYEGMDIAEDASGLITYMRTDSVALSGEAVTEIRKLIGAQYGEDALADAPRVFKNKSKNAQEAHEAIRPTSAYRQPKDLKKHLNRDQIRLYELIWQRAVASQMQHATIDTVAVDLAAGDKSLGHTFRATGSTIRLPGFMAVYIEGQDDKKNEERETMLPPMAVGDTVAVKEIQSSQHFTDPPPRYNEATLVKILEAHGIGRPSTYASIISTLQQREYVLLEKRRFEPTEVGKVVNRFLCEHFSRYVDYEFTAKLEDSLDEISRGEQMWKPVMQKFWDEFNKQIMQKSESVDRNEAIRPRELGKHPKTGKPIFARIGRFGPCVQLGEKDDVDKPKFAGLAAGQKLDTITLEEALKLFNLPRELGETPEGEKVIIAIGRYGPYARYGDKFVSLGENDPYTIDLETALKLIVDKKAADANRIILDFKDEGIQVLNGRYGKYVTDGEKNAKLPKEIEDPKKMSVDECKELLKNAKPSWRKKATKKK